MTSTTEHPIEHTMYLTTRRFNQGLCHGVFHAVGYYMVYTMEYHSLGHDVIHSSVSHGVSYRHEESHVLSREYPTNGPRHAPQGSHGHTTWCVLGEIHGTVHIGCPTTFYVNIYRVIPPINSSFLGMRHGRCTIGPKYEFYSNFLSSFLWWMIMEYTVEMLCLWVGPWTKFLC